MVGPDHPDTSICIIDYTRVDIKKLTQRSIPLNPDKRNRMEERKQAKLWREKKTNHLKTMK